MSCPFPVERRPGLAWHDTRIYLDSSHDETEVSSWLHVNGCGSPHVEHVEGRWVIEFARPEPEVWQILMGELAAHEIDLIQTFDD